LPNISLAVADFRGRRGRCANCEESARACRKSVSSADSVSAAPTISSPRDRMCWCGIAMPEEDGYASSGNCGISNGTRRISCRQSPHSLRGSEDRTGDPFRIPGSPGETRRARRAWPSSAPGRREPAASRIAGIFRLAHASPTGRRRFSYEAGVVRRLDNAQGFRRSPTLRERLFKSKTILLRTSLVEGAGLQAKLISSL
jgi:hypothetical protein